MSDELLTLIDARGQSAGAALHRAAAVHPWTAKPPKRNVVWVRPALVLAAVVALVAGLVWVARKPTEPAGHTPAGLRYVIGNVPEGWTLEYTQDADPTQHRNANGVVLATYGTYDDPTAPYVQIGWQDPAHSGGLTLAGMVGMANYSNLREVAAGGTVAACGDDGQIVHCAVVLSEGPVQVTASRATDAQIGQLLAALQIVNGEPFVAPASVPAGMATLAHGDLFAHPSITWAWQHTPDQTVAGYSDVTGENGVTLATGWASENDMAAVAAFAALTRVDVGSGTGYLGTIQGPNLHELVWRDGDRTFALTSGDGTLDLVALAESVRPAADTEWAAALVVRVVEGESGPEVTFETTPAVPETDPGASGETTPPVSVPADPTITRDVPVTQVVEPVSANDATYRCELPDGSFGALQVAVAANTVFMREPSGQSGSTSFQLTEDVFTIGTYMDTGAGTAVMAISTDPAATQLRVTRSNGERYVLDLLPAHGHPDVHLGVVLIPKGTLVTFDVIDADGNVIEFDPQVG